MKKFSKRPGKDATETAKEKWRKYLNNETKSQKYERVSKPIIYSIIRNLNRLEKIVRSSSYEPSFDQVNHMTEILHEKVLAVQNAFNPSKSVSGESVDIAEQDVNRIFGENQEGN